VQTIALTIQGVMIGIFSSNKTGNTNRIRKGTSYLFVAVANDCNAIDYSSDYFITRNQTNKNRLNAERYFDKLFKNKEVAVVQHRESNLLIEMPHFNNLTTTYFVDLKVRYFIGSLQSLSFFFESLVLEARIKIRGYIYGLFQFGLYGF
jgi:hypothetical protein